MSDVELTVCIPGQCCRGYCVDDTLHDLSKDQADRVRDVVAARLSALTAERDQLRLRLEYGAENEIDMLDGLHDQAIKERDAARAELAAANAQCRDLEREIDERDKAHEGIVATITAAARKDTRTAKSDAAKVQLLSQRLDDMKLSRDKHRNRADSLQARLDRVTALADEWALCLRDPKRRTGWSGGAVLADLRRALADSGTKDEPLFACCGEWHSGMPCLCRCGHAYEQHTDSIGCVECKGGSCVKYVGTKDGSNDAGTD